MPRKTKNQPEVPSQQVQLPERYVKLLKDLAALGEHPQAGDRHPTVSALRVALERPPAGKLYTSTLAAYIQGLRIVTVYMVGTTHVYWWQDGEACSLKLPEWARAIMRGHEPIVIRPALEEAA